MSQLTDMADGERVESWKGIASYFGRQVRTVQRWEREEGLPVHRLSHKRLGTVFAYKAELEAWRASRAMLPSNDSTPKDDVAPQPPPFASDGASIWSPRTVRAAAGACVLAAIALSAAVWSGGRSFRRPHMQAAASPPAMHRYFAEATRDGGRIRLIPGSSDMQFLAVSRDGSLLYDADTSGGLQIVRVADERVIGRLAIPPHTSGMAMSPDGRTIYLANLLAPLVTVVDASTHAVRTVPTEGAASSVALSPDGRSLYLAMPYRGMERIDTATEQSSHIAAPACPQQLAVAPDGQRLYISFQCGSPGGHDPVGVLNLATGAIVALWKGAPLVGSDVALSADGGELFADSGNACTAPQYDHAGCPSGDAQLLYVFNTTTGALLNTVAAQVVRSGAGDNVRFGRIAPLPGGMQVVDGTYILDTTRFSRLEALPAVYRARGRAAPTPDGVHLYLPVERSGTSGIADFAAAAKSCTPPTDALISWWPADGTPDDAWSIVPGHPSPGVDYGPGVIGQAFAFSHAGDRVSFGDHQDLVGRFEHFTVAGWVKFAATRSAALVHKMGADGSGWWLGTDDRSHLTFRVGTGDRNESGDRFGLHGRTELRPGVWRHVGVAASGSTVVLYLDGREEARGSLDLRFSSSYGVDLRLGSDDRGNVFTGLLDELTVYDRALRTPELQALTQMAACASDQ